MARPAHRLKYMKNWEQLAETMLLVEQHFRLDYRGTDIGMIYRRENFAEWLDEKDREHNGVLVSAIQQFAGTGRWPEITREQSLLMHARVLNALLLLRALASTANGQPLSNPAAHIPGTVHLVWLLDTVWGIYRPLGLIHASQEMLKS